MRQGGTARMTEIAVDMEPADAVVAPPDMCDMSPLHVPGKPQRKLSRRQRREAKQRQEAASAEGVETCDGALPSGGEAVATAPPSEETCSVASGSVAPADAVAITIEQATPTTPSAADAASESAGPWDWPRPVRVMLVVCLYPLLMAVTFYTLVMNIVLVTPALLLSRCCSAPRGRRALAAARFLAQRPLLALGFCVMAPLLYGQSYGVDFTGLPVSGGHPPNLRSLVAALRPGKRGKKVFDHMTYACRHVAAAGVTATWVPADSMGIGVEHRRLILHHAVCHNTTVLGSILMSMSYINLAHLVAASGVEFRREGQLVGLALIAPGAYSCGTVFSQRTELSRCGMWAVAMTMALERMCLPPEADGAPEQRVAVFDVGPTFGAQKSLLGMHPLPYARTCRIAWTA